MTTAEGGIGAEGSQPQEVMMIRRLHANNEYGDFVCTSIAQDLADTVSGIGFEDVANELRNGTFNVTQIGREDEGPDWHGFVERELAETGSSNCLDVSWFFLEYYIYRKVIGALGYFNVESDGFQRDPWQGKKDEVLQHAIAVFSKAYKENPNPSLHLAISACLLAGSKFVAEPFAAETIKSMSTSGYLLVDDRQYVEPFLSSHVRGTVVIVLNECGVELLADLRLASMFAQDRKVELHVKSYPCFALAATQKDVRAHIDRLASESLKLGRMLKRYLDMGQIKIVEDEFYVSPLEFTEAPEHLRASYDASTLIILKGDNIYRRLLGDRPWPGDLYSLGGVTTTFTNVPVLALRTCVSPIIVGLTRSRKSSLAFDWYLNEEFAIIQFSIAPLPEEAQEDQFHQQPQHQEAADDAYMSHGSDVPIETIEQPTHNEYISETEARSQQPAHEEYMSQATQEASEPNHEEGQNEFLSQATQLAPEVTREVSSDDGPVTNDAYPANCQDLTQTLDTEHQHQQQVQGDEGNRSSYSSQSGGGTTPSKGIEIIHVDHDQDAVQHSADTIKSNDDQMVITDHAQDAAQHDDTGNSSGQQDVSPQEQPPKQETETADQMSKKEESHQTGDHDIDANIKRDGSLPKVSVNETSSQTSHPTTNHVQPPEPTTTTTTTTTVTETPSADLPRSFSHGQQSDTVTNGGNDLDSADFSLPSAAAFASGGLSLGGNSNGIDLSSPRHETGSLPSLGDLKRGASTSFAEPDESKRSRAGSTARDILDNDDALQDADEMLWLDPSLMEGGLDAFLEEMGSKQSESNRPFINATLPQRALTSFEYFSRTRPNEPKERSVDLWNHLTKVQKHKYEIQAAQDKSRYEKELLVRAREVALAIRSSLK